MTGFARQQQDILTALYSAATRLIHACTEPEAIEQADLHDRAAALNAVSRIMRMFQPVDNRAAPSGSGHMDWDFGLPDPDDAGVEAEALRASAVKSVSPQQLQSQVRPFSPDVASAAKSRPQGKHKSRAASRRQARHHQQAAASPARPLQSPDRPRGMRPHDLVAPQDQPLEQRDQRRFT